MEEKSIESKHQVCSVVKEWQVRGNDVCEGVMLLRWWSLWAAVGWVYWVSALLIAAGLISIKLQGVGASGTVENVACEVGVVAEEGERETMEAEVVGEEGNVSPGTNGLEALKDIS